MISQGWPAGLQPLSSLHDSLSLTNTLPFPVLLLPILAHTGKLGAGQGNAQLRQLRG